MVDIKILKTSIGAITKEPEMFRLIPDYLKVKNMFRQAVKKIQFVINYVRDRHKTQTNA